MIFRKQLGLVACALNGARLGFAQGVCSEVQAQIGELIIAQPIVANVSVSTNGPYAVCQGLTVDITNAPTLVETTYTFYQTTSTTAYFTSVSTTPAPGITKGTSASGQVGSTLYYIGGTGTTVLTLPPQSNSPSQIVTVLPVSTPLVAGAQVRFVTTLYVAYPGTATASLTLFSTLPTSGVDPATLLIETPTGNGNSQTSTSGQYYLGMGSVLTVTIPATGTQPAVVVTAQPVPTLNSISIVTTLIVPYSGFTTTSYTVFSSILPPGSTGVNSGTLVIETPSVGTGPSTNALSTIGPVTTGSSTTAGIGSSSTTDNGSSTTSGTAFSSATDTGPSTISSSTAGPTGALSQLIAYGATAPVTLTIPATQGTALQVITASPQSSISGVTVQFVSTITAFYTGTILGRETLLRSSATPGINDVTLVIEEPATTASDPATTLSYYYLATDPAVTSTVAILLDDRSSGIPPVVSASPVYATGITPSVTSTDLISSGSIPFSIYVFTTIPTPGVDTGLLYSVVPVSLAASSSEVLSSIAITLPTITDTSSGNIAATISAISGISSGNTAAMNTSSASQTVPTTPLSIDSTAYYLGGPDVITLDNADGEAGSAFATAITVFPTAVSSVTVSIVQTITLPYTGSSTSTFTIFKLIPTPGFNFGIQVIETPAPTGALQELYYLGGTSILTLSNPSSYSGLSPIATAQPVTAIGVIPQIVATVTLTYSGSVDLTFTIFTTSPTPNIVNAATLLIEEPAAIVSSVLSSQTQSVFDSSTLSNSQLSIPSAPSTSLPISSIDTSLGLSVSNSINTELSSLPSFSSSISTPATDVSLLTSVQSTSAPESPTSTAVPTTDLLSLSSQSLAISSFSASQPSSFPGLVTSVPSIPSTDVSSGLTSPSLSALSSLSLSSPSLSASISSDLLSSLSLSLSSLDTGISTLPSTATSLVLTSPSLGVTASTDLPSTQLSLPSSQITGVPTSASVDTSLSLSNPPLATTLSTDFSGSQISSVSRLVTSIPVLPTDTAPVTSIPINTANPSSILSGGLETISVGIPTGGLAFTTTFVEPGDTTIVLVGIPTGPFVPGTSTGILFPGALEFTTTIVFGSQTEVVIGLSAPTSLPTNIPSSLLTVLPSTSLQTGDLSTLLPSPTVSPLPSSLLPSPSLPALSSLANSLSGLLSSLTNPGGNPSSVPSASPPGLPSLQTSLPGLPTSSLLGLTSILNTGTDLSGISSPTLPGLSSLPSSDISTLSLSSIPTLTLPGVSSPAVSVASTLPTLGVSSPSLPGISSPSLPGVSSPSLSSVPSLSTSGASTLSLPGISSLTVSGLSTLSIPSVSSLPVSDVSTLSLPGLSTLPSITSLPSTVVPTLSVPSGVSLPTSVDTSLPSSAITSLPLSSIPSAPSASLSSLPTSLLPTASGVLSSLASGLSTALPTGSLLPSASSPSGTCAPLSTSTCAANAIASSAQSIVDALNSVTEASQDLEASASNLDATPEGIQAAAALASGFNGIVTSLQSDLQQFANVQPLDSVCDQAAVITALTKFVQVHQALLNIVIGKSGLIAQVPLAGPPVAAGVRAVEGVVDTVAFALIGLLPDPNATCQAQQQKSAIDGTLSQAVGALGGTSVPSLTSVTIPGVSATSALPSSVSGTCAPLATSTCAAVQIAGSAQSLIDAIDTITTLSQNLQSSASNIDTSLTGISAAASVASGLSNIANTITQDIATLGSVQPFDAVCDEAAVVVALTKFVQVHQALLNIIIGKAGLISSVPLAGPPVAAGLRAIESVVDTIAFDIIGLIPDAQCQATQQKNALDGTLAQALSAYGVANPITTALPTTITSIPSGVTSLPSVVSSLASGSCAPLATSTCAAVAVASSAQSIIDAINTVTTLSQNLQQPASNIGTDVGGLSAAASVASGLANIATALTQDLTSLSSIQPFDAVCDEAAIAEALTKFVQVHQALLNIVIGKAGLIASVPVAGPPVAAAIRTLESAVDAIAFAIIGLIPDAQCQANVQKAAIDSSLGQAVAAYGSALAVTATALPTASTSLPGAVSGSCVPLATSTCAAVAIAGSAQTIIDALNAVTSASQDLQTDASNLGSGISGLSAAANVASGLTNIAAALTQDVASLSSVQPLDAVCDEAAVVTALTKFVQVHQALLNIIIGKSGLIADIPLAGPPVAAGIRAVESVVDTIAFAIIGLLPDAACQATAQKNAIDGSLLQAVNAYSSASPTAPIISSVTASATATSTVCPALPSCPAAQVAGSAQTIIDLINTISTASNALIAPAGNLGNAFTGTAAVATVGAGLTNIAATITADVPKLLSINPFDVECDEVAITTALTKFVQIHQALLNVIIGKAGLIAAVPFAGPPIATGIRAVEGVVDTLAFALIGLIPDTACQATAQKNALDQTLSQAVAAYATT